MKLAFLFPGQGAQKVGMGRELAEQYPAARGVFEEANQVLGFDLAALCWEGPEDELKKTVHTQPALLTHSVAALRLLEAHGIRPAFAAGHSLGEYSALVAAGALGFADALRLVQRRGALMYQAGLDKPGAMAAILGLDLPTVEAACRDAAALGVVVPANLNAPGQVVVSGEPAAVEAASVAARARGAKRAIRLEVSGAFHSPLMAPAAAGLAEALDGVTIHDARFPVVANVSAQPVARHDEIRAALKAQLLGAVRWEESTRRLLHEGVEAFIEVGTGTVLRGLLRSVDREARSFNVDDPDSLSATLAALGATARSPAQGASR